MTTATEQNEKPTIVFVHGAFADSSSWNGVMDDLTAKGYRVVGAANPLRSAKGDAAYIASIVDSLEGPVVLVGHSYGGTVISNVVNENVEALVYVSAFAPDEGESSGELSNRYPGSTLGGALAAPVALPGDDKDLYIQQDRFPAQFAADVPLAEARLMAEGQRPIAESALAETSGPPAWKSVPSWFIYGTGDRNIPAAAIAFMAERAGSKETVVVEGASHVVMVSHPHEVAELIARAADATEAAPSRSVAA